jgi:hypothetical protein
VEHHPALGDQGLWVRDPVVLRAIRALGRDDRGFQGHQVRTDRTGHGRVGEPDTGRIGRKGRRIIEHL